MNDMIKPRRIVPVMLTACSVFLSLGSMIAPLPVEAQSQNEMNMTAARDFAKADARLNKVYKQILAKDLEPPTKRKLIASEKAWVAYRDAEAEFEGSAAAEGGSMYPMIYDGTRMRLTEKRIKELKESMQSP